MAIYGIYTKHKGSDNWEYTGRTFFNHRLAVNGLKKYKNSLKKMGVDIKHMEFKIS